MKKYRLTKKHKAKFFSFVQKWQQNLGLQKWNINVEVGSLPVYAQVEFDSEKTHKFATIVLGKEWPTPPKTQMLEQAACHEMLHILLYDFAEYCCAHPKDENGIIEKEHEVVNTLEKLLMNDKK